MALADRPVREMTDPDDQTQPYYAYVCKNCGTKQLQVHRHIGHPPKGYPIEGPRCSNCKKLIGIKED